MTETALAKTGSQTISVLGDVVTDLQLVAKNAEEMKLAQQSMAHWFAAKQKITERDADELQQNFEIAKRNGWKTDTLKRHARLAQKRVEFYEKCKLASEAGYCIMPNLPAEVFAIRTKKRLPKRDKSSWEGGIDDVRSESPAAGEGAYVDASPFMDTRQVRDGMDKETGELKYRTEYFASSFDDEIEFPISVAKPEIMNETSRAMALEVFDEIAVLPGRRGRGDPLVLGVIRHPDRTTWEDRRVTFLLAWYVDTGVL